MVCRFCGDPVEGPLDECGPCKKWLESDSDDYDIGWSFGVLNSINFFQGRKLGSEILLGIAQQIADGKTGARGDERE